MILNKRCLGLAFPVVVLSLFVGGVTTTIHTVANRSALRGRWLLSRPELEALQKCCASRAPFSPRKRSR